MPDKPRDGTPITAVALDGGVDLEKAAGELPWKEQRRYAYGRAYEVGASARLYVFTFGAIVLDGATKLDAAITEPIAKVFGRKALPFTSETYFVSVDPEHIDASPRVGWDQVVIPERSVDLMAAIAMLLGQSAALERYEKASEQFLDEGLLLTQQLATRGVPPRANRDTLRRVGRLMTDRLELPSLFFLQDRPEEAWEDPRVAALYDALFRNLEIEQRYRAMFDNLHTVEHVIDVILNIWQSRVSRRLEWAIVLLIVFEIVLALVRH
ncbi:MAG: RMD1 family protein [Deltaproteobacteria bacterium]|nr:RMD1 family protein [Deltaproteobacteria bacterium]